MTIETPVTVVGEQEKYATEEVLEEFAGKPKVGLNYASDPDVVQQVRAEILPILIQARSDRTPLEEEWKQVRRMLMLIHDSGKKYNGRSDAYLPAWARTQGTITSSLVRGLFPSDDYIEASADDDDISEEEVRTMKVMMQDVLTSQVGIRTQMKLAARDYVNYGLSIVKSGYKKEIRRKVKLKRSKDGAGLEAESQEYKDEGVRVYARSPFFWYAYPQTANSLEECTVIFEDIDVSRAFLTRMGKQGVFLHTDLVGTSDVAEHVNNVSSQLIDVTRSGNTPLNNAFGSSPQGEFLTITEVWTDMVLPESAYLAGEDPTCPVSTKLIVAGDTVLEVTRNVFWEQRPPYRVVRHEPMTGSFYSRSDGLRVRSLQYLANDFANQTNDNGVYMLNPIAKVNPALMAGPMPPLRPGVTIPMQDMAGLEFDRPPFEQVNTGMAMEQMCITQIQDFAGAPPALQGASGGKNAKTATGMQLLQRNALGPIQDVVEDFETEMLVPLMQDIQGLLEQYAPDQFWVRDGKSRREVSRALLAKRFGWRWLASSQAINQQQRAQNLLNFVPLIAQLAPMLQQGGYGVDLEPLLANIYNDGFGMRGFDKVVFKAPMQPGLPPGAQVPGAIPGQAGPQQDPAASALRNSNNPADQAQGENMVPGEGDEYANVRGEADQIAAALGAQYGTGVA